SLGPVRHSERVRRGRVEPARPLVLPQCIADGGRAVTYGERLDPVAVAPDDLARTEVTDLQRVCDATHDNPEGTEEGSRPARAVDRDRDFAATEPKRLQHSWQAEHVIGVEMREEDVLEIDQTYVGAEQLPLRALAAVDENP